MLFGCDHRPKYSKLAGDKVNPAFPGPTGTQVRFINPISALKSWLTCATDAQGEPKRWAVFGLRHLSLT
jgi:hypothetical protein